MSAGQTPVQSSFRRAAPLATPRSRLSGTAGSIVPRLTGPTLLLVALTFNAVLLAPELRVGQANVNDNVFHLAASERLADALAHGEPFLDPWVSEWSLGYPVWRSYQPLPHLLAAAVLRATEPIADHDVVFAAFVYVLLVFLPASAYVGARLLGLCPAAAGLASLLVLAPSSWGEYGRYGVGYGAVTWRGSGLYTQLVALVFLLPTLGLVVGALDHGRRRAAAAVFLALTALSHIVFGYVAFLSAAILALVGPAWERSRRIVRLVTIVVPALLLLIWFAVPLLLTAGEVNHSRWEDAHKWDSYGAAVILGDLFSGTLLDAGRLPWLSILAALGTVAAMLSLRQPLARRLLALAICWLVLFFGRRTWGHLLLLVGVPSDLHLHRLQAAVELALLLLSAWGVERTISAATRRGHRLGAVAVAVVAVFLIFVGRERALYLADNATWGENNLLAVEGERGDLTRALAEVHAILDERPGRASAGLAAGWGKTFKVGSVPVYAFLTREHIDQASFLYHSMSLTSDIMTLRDDQNGAHNVALGIRALVAPEGMSFPPHLKHRGTFGRFAVYEASPEGYFGLVDIGAMYTGPPGARYEPNAAWLGSNYLQNGIVVALDPDTPNLPEVPSVGRWEPFPVPDPALFAPRGRLVAETKDGETYRARMKLDRPTYAFVKLTWFPDLVATVDGRPADVVRVTPGFAAVPVPAGEHEVVVRYEPGMLKPTLLVIGIGLFAVWFGGLRLVGSLAETWWVTRLASLGARLAAVQVAAPFALLAVALLALRPLFRGLLVGGHDATEYPPRLVEFMRAIGDGHLPPVWAADLGNGHGQPLFQFAPPLVYLAATPLRLLGLGLADCLQLALALLFIAGAFAVYGICRRASLGRQAAVAASAAWLFAPYQSLDLFVRSAFAEAAGVAVAPLAVLAVLRAADRPSAWRATLGGVTLALVVLAHNAVSLLLVPGLVAVGIASAIGRRRPSLHLLATGGTIISGIGLSAFFWLPALLEPEDVKVELLREGFLHWSQHFASGWQLLWSPWGFGTSGPGPDDGMSFALGPLHLLLGAAGFVFAWRGARSRLRREAIAFALLAIAGVLLATSWSTPLWSKASPLQYLAYPWRSLFLPALFLPLLSGFAFERLGRRGCFVALVSLIALNLPHTAARQYLTFDDEYYAPGSIAEKGINTTTREEYEPRWVMRRSPYSKQRLIGPVDIRDQSLRTDRQVFHVHVREAGLVEAATFYYPGWTVEVDGGTVPAEPVPVSGTISFPLPKGEHTVVLALRRTSVRKIGLDMTMVTLTLLVLALAIERLRRRTGAVPPSGCSDRTLGGGRGVRRHDRRPASL